MMTIFVHSLLQRFLLDYSPFFSYATRRRKNWCNRSLKIIDHASHLFAWRILLDSLFISQYFIMFTQLTHFILLTFKKHIFNIHPSFAWTFMRYARLHSCRSWPNICFLFDPRFLRCISSCRQLFTTITMIQSSSFFRLFCVSCV